MVVKPEKEVEYKLIRVYRKFKEIDMSKPQSEFYFQEPIVVEGMNAVVANDKNDDLTLTIRKYENEQANIYKYSLRAKTSSVVKIFGIKIKDERSIEAMEVFKNIGVLGFIEKFAELLLFIGAAGITIRYSVLINSFKLDNDNINEINADVNINSSIFIKSFEKKKLSENYNQKNMWFKIKTNYTNYDEEIYARQILEETFEKFEELILVAGINDRDRTRIWYRILLSDLFHYLLVTRICKIITTNWKIAQEL